MRRRGFSLIELMIAVAVVSMISIYMSYSLTVNEQAYQAVDQTVESQQNLRAVMDLLERDVRHAALMMPEAASSCGVDQTNGPDTLYLSDGSAVDPGSDTSEFPGVDITAAVTLQTLGVATLVLDQMVVESTAPFRASVDTNGDGTPDSDFRPGGGVIIFDAANPDLGTACGRIRNLNAATQTLVVDLVAAFDSAPVDPRVLPANEYRIVGTDLQWNGIVLSGNIEDLQVAWIFDTDGDNVVDAGEVYGAKGGTQYRSSGPTSGTTHENAADLRELRVGLVARSRRDDDEFGTGQPQALENRNAGAFVSDGYRRRSVSARLRLRNLGMRG